MKNRLTRWYAGWIDALLSAKKVITILWDIMLLEEVYRTSLIFFMPDVPYMAHINFSIPPFTATGTTCSVPSDRVTVAQESTGTQIISPELCVEQYRGTVSARRDLVRPEAL